MQPLYFCHLLVHAIALGDVIYTRVIPVNIK